MRFQIPQNVQREDTIIGPVTFMQLAIVLIGGGLTYVAYLFLVSMQLSIYVWAPVVIVMAAITITIAFLKIFDMKFYHFFFYMLEYNFKPKKRFWSKDKEEFHMSVLNKIPNITSDQAKIAQPKTTDRQKLEEISKKLDI